ncbi:MAG: hypothetical protein LQ350_001794 [Teloschistes chrysophthalmus]|nr:MAG: hypothetical protein LQ350_001794 [Niorma chrysophthalma]
MLSSTCGNNTANHGPQKLSKPPTNTSSSNLLAAARGEPELVSPLPPSDADSADGYFPKMLSANGDRRARRNTRTKIRSYFQGSSPENGQMNSSEDEGHSPRKLTNVARDMKRRLSRNDSSNLLHSSGGVSAASSSSQLFMADAHRSDLDEDELMKEQIKEKVWSDTIAAQNHVSSPIDEDKHPDSLKSPIRRRSLYTPGIATRSPEDILRKLPPPEHCTPQATRDYYYNPAFPQSSPLSRLANLKSSPNGRSTPVDLDYAHLGALKLGTLRVTNGAVSPIPRDQNVSPASQDEYYTASDGGKSEGQQCSSAINLLTDTPCVPPQCMTKMYPEVQDTKAEPISHPRTSSLDTGTRGQTVYEMESPASVQTISPISQSIKRKPLPRTATVRPRQDTSILRTDYRSERHATSDCNNLDSCQTQQKSPELTLGGTPEKSQDAASATSQNSGADVWRSFIRTAEERHAINGSREDAFLALTRNQSTHNQYYDGATLRPKPQRSQLPSGERPTQYDSGYISNESLESMEGPTMKEDARTSAFSMLPDGQRSLSPLPLDASEMTNPSRESTNGIERPSTSALKTYMRTDTNADMSCARNSFDADRNIEPPKSVQKQPSSPVKSRKLQKKRPKSQSALPRNPVADYPLDRDEIPPVPDVVAIRHSDHVSRFPVLEHTYSNLEPADTDPMFPSRSSAPAEARFPSPTQERATSAIQDKPSLFQKLASRARSRSRSRPRKEQLSHDSDAESVKSDICRSPSWSDYGNSKRKERKKREKAEQEVNSEICRSPSWSDYGNSEKKERKRREKAEKEAQKENHSDRVRKVTPEDNFVSSRYRSRSLTGQTAPFIGENHRDQSIAAPKPGRPYSMYADPAPVPASPAAEMNLVGSGPYDYSPVHQNTCSSRETTQQPSLPNFAAKAEALPDNTSHASMNAPSAKEPSSIEQLIDALLDAPNAEAQGSILQQIRQQRHKLRERAFSNAPQTSSSATNPMNAAEAPHHPEGMAEAVAKSDHLSSVLNESPATAPKHEFGQLPARTNVRPHSICVEVPPMPPLPTDERLQQQEARRLAAKSDRPKTLIPPRTRITEIPKKDLWAGGAIQTEHKKAIESQHDWETHQSAWSQRRKSAGEALLRKDGVSELGNASNDVEPEDTTEELARPPAVSRAMTAGADEPLIPTKNGNRAFHRPWAPQDQQLPSNKSTGALQSNQKVAETAQAFERLTGRFEGGLIYGYEPGFGLGGSAGTRSIKTGATRKSLQMSQNYGVDLSDVPIFVAPST